MVPSSRDSDCWSTHLECLSRSRKLLWYCTLNTMYSYVNDHYGKCEQKLYMSEIHMSNIFDLFSVSSNTLFMLVSDSCVHSSSHICLTFSFPHLHIDASHLFTHTRTYMPDNYLPALAHIYLTAIHPHFHIDA